ncbi:MAG: PilZ domain-containing protein [Anaeromyxobacteraceae bacterium]
MSFSDWIRQFRQLHAEAKKGTLTPEDLADYRTACDEFARALITAQRLPLKPGELPRHTLRVARALQVELESPVTLLRVTTVDVGVAGFAAILPKAPRIGDEFVCKLKLPDGDPVETTVIADEVRPQPGSARISFHFPKLSDATKGRLEVVVIDTALSQLAT